MDVFQGLPSNSVPLLLTSSENLRKSAKISEKNCRPPQVWFILGSNFQMKVPCSCSSVQTIVCKYKHHGTTQPSYSWGRRHVLSPRDERTLVWKDVVEMLEETGAKVSISTVKRVLYWHNLKGHSARKKPLLQNRHKKSQITVCNCIWRQRSYFLEKCPLVWWNKNRTVWP